MPDFHPEHFYLWVYAGFSMAAFGAVTTGAFVLLRRVSALATWLLVGGGLCAAGSLCVNDLGWLILSEGQGAFSCLEEPAKCKMLERFRGFEHALQYTGVALIALGIPLLAHDSTRIRSL
jgi:hypothetical protein